MKVEANVSQKFVDEAKRLGVDSQLILELLAKDFASRPATEIRVIKACPSALATAV